MADVGYTTSNEVICHTNRERLLFSSFSILIICSAWPPCSNHIFLKGSCLFAVKIDVVFFRFQVKQSHTAPIHLYIKEPGDEIALPVGTKDVDSFNEFSQNI